MRPLIEEMVSLHSPETLVEQLNGEPGVVLLRSSLFDSPQARYSFVATRPFLNFRSFGSRCELWSEREEPGHHIQFGNPWRVLDGLMSRYELLDEIDLPFPLGGCFGYWGYDLKNFVEPKLSRRAVNDLELPDCSVGFYDSLVVFDHHLAKTWIVSTGLELDGSRNQEKGRRQLRFWITRLQRAAQPLDARESNPPAEHTIAGAPFSTGREPAHGPSIPSEWTVAPSNVSRESSLPGWVGRESGAMHESLSKSPLPTIAGRVEWDRRWRGRQVVSNFSRADFVAAVERARRYIRAGDIYQVNLSQRLAAPCSLIGWDFFRRLASFSPAPFAAFIDCGEFQIASSSPELFLRLSGPHIQTRPIKGTRPRSADAARDAQLSYELQTSAKEMAELVMITDLLRNDLGKVCEYGSVQVPELVRLERYPHVQHLVSTIEGRLRSGVSHFGALASCFPGGSITGAPKIRAMEIIDELEPITRGPYTGTLGYLGFNRESQLSILIRSAVCRQGMAYFHVGAGIVADSAPSAEYEETLAKAGGFFATLNLHPESAYAFLQ
jgi:para-aminobenzoate synthetase component 1